MINPALFRALGGLVDEQTSLTADGLVDILLDQGFALEDISDTIFWVFESESSTFQRRVFTPWEQWIFPVGCQSLLIHLAASGLVAPETIESVIWRILLNNDQPVSFNHILAECMHEITDPLKKAILTPNIIRQ